MMIGKFLGELARSADEFEGWRCRLLLAGATDAQIDRARAVAEQRAARAACTVADELDRATRAWLSGTLEPYFTSP